MARKADTSEKKKQVKFEPIIEAKKKFWLLRTPVGLESRFVPSYLFKKET
jgi:hypothetical protein